MGSIDKLTVTEQSEAFKKEGDKVIVGKSIENEDSSDDSDSEELALHYEHRGRLEQPAAGKTTAATIRPAKQNDKTKLTDEEHAAAAAAAAAKAKAETTSKK